MQPTWHTRQGSGRYQTPPRPGAAPGGSVWVWAVENYSGPTDTLCSCSWTIVILSGSYNPIRRGVKYRCPSWITLSMRFFGVIHKTKKVANTRLRSVRFRSWSRFLAVSPHVTWVINPTVGCHYFLPGPRLPPQPFIRAATNFAAWWTEAQWVWTVCLKLLPTASRLRFEPGPFCAWVKHANHSATEPPSIKLEIRI